MDAKAKFPVFAPEIWMMVIKNLSNYWDIERTCIAIKNLRTLVSDYLAERKQREVIKCLLRGYETSASDALKIRQVCKNWKNVVDEFCSRLHTRSCSWDWSKVPHVTIKLPLDESGLKLVNDLAECNQDPFIAGRLTLEMSTTFISSSLSNNDLNELLEVTKPVWNYVKHLRVLLENVSCHGVEAMLKPWLQKMTNVVLFKSSLTFGGLDAMHCLPNLEKLEHMFIRNGCCGGWMEHEYPNQNWSGVFAQCGATLKSLSVVKLDLHLREAIKSVQFVSLEHFNSQCDEIDTEDEDEGKKSCAINFMSTLITPGRFPGLKTVGMPLLSPVFYYMPEERWTHYYYENFSGSEREKRLDQFRNNNSNKVSFASELVDFTNRMASCKAVEINRSKGVAVSLEEYPIESCLHGKGSPAVTHLIVSCPRGQMEDVLKWSITISKLFSCLKYLEVNELKMIKSCLGNWIELGEEGHCLDWK